MDGVVRVLRAYFMHRVDNIDELLDTNSQDAKGAQDMIVRLIEAHGSEAPHKVLHMMYLLLDYHIVRELRAVQSEPVYLLTFEYMLDITDVIYKAMFPVDAAMKKIEFKKIQNLSEKECLLGLLCHIMTKCIPRACHMRSLTTVLHRYIKECPLLLHVVTDVVCCGILGNFQSSDVKVSANIRRFVYASKHVVRRVLEDISAKGAEDMYILFCIREYIMASVLANNALSNTVQTLVPKWNTIVSVITNVVNMARYTISIEAFKTIDTHLTSQNRHDMLFDYMHRCSTHMKMTNRTIPRLPLPTCIPSLPTFNSQHPCRENLLRTDALLDNVERSTLPSTDCACFVPTSCDVDLYYILRTVRNQVYQLAQHSQDDAYQTDVHTEHQEEKQVWKNYTITAAFMLGTCFAPGLIKLPREITVMQRNAARTHLSTSDTSLCKSTITDICTLYYCVACQEVKNVIEDGDHGMDMTSVDLSNDCFYCANHRCRIQERVPLLRLVLCTEDNPSSFMCVIHNQAYAVSPCCGRLVKIDPIHLLSDSATTRKCPACVAQGPPLLGENSESGVVKANSKDRAPARKCAHCEEPLRNKKNSHSVKVKEFSDSSTYELLPFCSAHYRNWMRTNADETGVLIMPKAQLHERVNETSKYYMRETDTYVQRKRR
ncbi:hypothetical protein CYMTET_8405 [Cymbomonas tetramitiformis]|uniref:Uncharacterized protein n=1 Tax=Cymbomonas tetramitiformis TaxID=36881 RepID=A0AAE0GTK2_9CHLO|nr:hypothetical protein CYMTET_8405 [Cymbomonas tetramitiformis]